MYKKTIFLLSQLFLISGVFAQQITESNFLENKITLKTKSGEIFGSLSLPQNLSNYPLVIIVAGSGPTDRNCNAAIMGLNTDAYKKLAYGLAANKIAVLRYDKRGVGESMNAIKKEEDLTFDSYINDLIEWIQLLKRDKRFSSITIIGHSEGALIGMEAAKYADKYISIAGAGKGIDSILTQQLISQPPFVTEKLKTIMDSLKQGSFVNDVPDYLMALFRPSVQPYMISWLKYNPQEEIKKLNIPILLIQGTKDLQVALENVKLLAKNNLNTKVEIIVNMNHVLFTIEGDDDTFNKASYMNNLLPINTELVKVIVAFVTEKNNKTIKM